MNSAAEHRTCPNCGVAIPANAPQGICPKCLLAAVAAPTDAGQTGGKRPEPPSLERLAAAFPQLEVIELIGQGGMGAVYKARQKQLDRIVALKVLPPGIGIDPSFAERFTREAKALAKLLHPNIVALFEFGQADGIYYLLMEYVDGVSLGQLLRSSRVSPREALAIVPQICDALQYAHDQGIVHRDIKPENILLDRRGRVKVADFGLAKLMLTEPGRAGSPLPAVAWQADDGAHGVTRPTDSLTDAGKVMGTPSYMAPEQKDHPGEVDHRADIYALGVVFYQMLTGELPGKRLEPPSKKVQIDVRLDEVVMRALEKKPELRYQQASVLKTEVETIATDVGSATAPPTGTSAKDRADQAATLSATKKKKGEFIGIGCAIQAVGIACFFIPSPGWILGIILLLLGGRMALKVLCSNCGNPTTREARICTTCGARFLPKGASPPSDARTPSRLGGWPKYGYVGAAAGVVGILAIWFCLHLWLRSPGPLVDILTQYQFQQLVDSNQIAEITICYDPHSPDLSEIDGRYYATDAEGNRLPEGDSHAKVPFRARVRLYPKLEARLLTLPQFDRHAGARNPAPVILVSATAARKGDLRVSLDTLGTVESSNSVSFVIPENYCQQAIKKFDAHQALTVEADNGQGERFGHGFLVAVDNRIDPETGTLKCKASLVPEGENLMVPGLFLRVHLLLEVKHGVILVPVDAVLHDAQRAFVWVIEPNESVRRRHVQTGTIDGAEVEIQSGLSPGDLVVIGLAKNNLHDGQQIRYKLVQSSVTSVTPVSLPVKLAARANPLQGTWLSQHTEANGTDWFSLVIQGSSLECHSKDTNHWFKGTFSLREDTNPKQLTAVITDGPDPQYVGKTANALYLVQDDTLTIAWSEPGDPVPAGFDAPDADKFVFKRKAIVPVAPTLEPAAGRPEATFGPVMERMVYDYKSGKDWLLNLETGETFSLPTGLTWEKNAADVWKWAHQHGVHITGLPVVSQQALYGFEMKAAVARGTNLTFESITPLQISTALRGPLVTQSSHNDGPWLFQLAGMDWQNLYAFQSDDGQRGVLQVIGMSEKPRGVKIRYKLLLARRDEGEEPSPD